jgi:lipopolysaccharide/colanic/teichoic acid biosynthesis glycosyltransferase
MARYSEYLDSRTKRAFDVVVCAVMLVPALIVMAGAGLVTLLAEGRPVLFFQRRIGKNGLLFRMGKIRTMRRWANPYRRSPKSEDSEVVTGTGRILRRHRIDELPQIFSVLAGRMSVVGPRPEIPEAAAGYGRAARRRLAARPGLTGLWQVLAGRKAAICDNVKYDLYYLRRASLGLDLKILVLTIAFVIRPQRKQRNYEDGIYTYKLSLSE